VGRIGAGGRRAAGGGALGTLALLALAVAIPGAPATGAVVSTAGLQYVSKSGDIPPHENGTFRAPCPSGTHVLGGGHYNNGAYNTVFPFHSYPYDGGDRNHAPDDGWKVDAGNGSAATKTVKAYAICSELSPTYEQRTVTVPPTPQRDLYLRCGEGHPVAGGSSAADNGNVPEVSSFPRTDVPKWGLRFDNYINSDLEVTGYAVCLKRNVDIETANTLVDAGTQVPLDVECPADRRVVGGGMDSSGAEQTVLIASSRPIGFTGPELDAWEVWPENRGPIQISASGWATCIRPPG
jgi:hypothetical protein